MGLGVVWTLRVAILGLDAETYLLITLPPRLFTHYKSFMYMKPAP